MSEPMSEHSPDPRADPGEDTEARRRLPFPPVAVAVPVLGVLALIAGGLVWLFQDDLFHPFGDARACEGSDAKLPAVISAGGATLPADASDIHYVVKDGTATVSFRSSQVPDYLHRTGLVPDGESLFDGNYDSKYALPEGETELPEGLCGPGVRGPVWTYISRGPANPAANVMVERSPVVPDRLRTPARVVAVFDVTTD